jgi:site-specific DNA-cytosine methylase
MSNALTTFDKDNVVVIKDTRNLKEKLCDELIESKILKVGDVINHSYTNSGKNPNSRLSLEDFIETTDGTLPTLTTRGDILGVVVREEYQGMYQYSKSDKFMHGKDRFTKNKEFADTLVTIPKEGVVVKNEINGSESLRIRKLTPREVFRLMGVKDRDYDKIADFSNSSLYKLAGNSIVIQVLMGIFGELLGIDYKKKIKESVN